MIVGLLGPPNCGKSRFAESLCAGLSRRLRCRPTYIATLPEDDVHRARIDKHRWRRGPRWLTRRIAFPASAVLRELRWLSRRERCLLLDGVTQLFQTQIVAYNLLERELDAFAEELLRILVRSGDHCVWIVVDALPKPVDEDPSLTPLVTRFHQALSARARVLQFARCEDI